MRRLTKTLLFVVLVFGLQGAAPALAGQRPAGSGSAEAAGPSRWSLPMDLIGRDGKVVAAFASSVDPLDATLTRAIEAQR